jgi:hypothetical protein
MSQVAKSPKEKIEAKRDSLEDLAASDLPCAELAELLLEVAENE